MPYIKQDRRALYDEKLTALIDELGLRGWEPGEVNYAVFRICAAWFGQVRRYATGAAVLGMLSAVGREFTRRLLDPYEDEQRANNGDVLGRPTEDETCAT